MENIISDIVLSALLAGGVMTLAFLLKKHLFHRAQTRNCPHCQNMIGAGQAICGSCHRTVILI